jgi:hypothetical protein
MSNGEAVKEQGRNLDAIEGRKPQSRRESGKAIRAKV